MLLLPGFFVILNELSQWICLSMQIKQKVLLDNAEYEERLALQEVLSSIQSNENMLTKLQLSVVEDTLETNDQMIELLQRQLNLEQDIAASLTKNNKYLRENTRNVEDELRRLESSHMKTKGQYRQIEEKIRSDYEQAQADLQSAQSAVSSLREQLALSERTAAAAQERAALAEQTLRQRETLAQAHASVQNSSQDLERRSRAEADARAAAAEARAATLEKEISWLQRQLEMKSRRVSGLEQAIKQREDTTPARGKAVDDALDAVGEFVSQLDSSPEVIDTRPGRARGNNDSKAEKKNEAQKTRRQAKHGIKKSRKIVKKMDEDTTSSDESASDFEDELKEAVRQSKSTQISKRKPETDVPSKTADHAKKPNKENNDDSLSPKRAKVNPPQLPSENDESNKENIHKKSVHKQGDAIENQLARNPLGALNGPVIAAAKQQSESSETLRPAPLKPLIMNPFGSNPNADGGKRRLLGVSKSNSNIGGEPLSVSMLYRTTSNNFQPPRLNTNNNKK